ncbi:hypothetical protein VHEMI03568 [[Torrubiella] hemipterigena]|uniref:18S rRNA factor 2 n=1 Tax=[Torrubiella] hemipterigena TaxID=1531966 RepID=A0A0A1SSX1_9HYPO|nr:hypothetical protein VHEMI03568 [[Torrubiella] hemipterigena]
MAPARADDFLGLSDSEGEDVGGYNSDAEVQKGIRSAKRRRLSDDEDAGSDSEDEAKALKFTDEKVDEDEEQETVANDESKSKSKKADVKIPELKTALPDITRPATKKNLVATEAAIKKSGVVYMSRIPPFMKPAKVRSLLEPYGTINRIFLAPEDPAAHARRVKAGGNKKKSYTEGWVEFVKKKEAKAACELLNARTIGGKKGSYYRDDIWNLLYLNGFKWNNLTQQIAAEDAERASRMRAEISKTTKENKEFVRNVERAKMLDGMQAKSKKRKADAGEDASTAPLEEGSRTFKQIPLAKKAKETDEPSERVSRVLSKIF